MCFLKTVPYVPVEEANFERVSNFGQKKGFLCELLLTHLSLCRDKNFFYRSKYVILNFAELYN